MKVGFTGTQLGMTPQQKENFEILLESLRATELHHGDCIGADADAHAVARRMKVRVVLHPPDNHAKRAYSEGSWVIRRELPYLTRNKQIVDETEMLISTPKGVNEERRSGTWSTVRYARKKGRLVWILYPDGTIVSNGPLPTLKGG